MSKIRIAYARAAIRHCRRGSDRAFACRWIDLAEGDLIGRGRASVFRARDGLIRCTLGRTRLVFEPR